MTDINKILDEEKLVRDMTNSEPPKDGEVMRLNDLINIFKALENIITCMNDKDEYDRVRIYISDRFGHSLNYNHSRFEDKYF